MGKPKGKQRTKGNRMPSSSSKTVQLLSKNTEDGSSSIGFVGFQAHGDLGYVPVLENKEGFDSNDIDPEFRIVLRKLFKKDQVTKLKAISEFKELCKTKPDESQTVLPYWSRIYNRLTQDPDRKIREGIHQAIEALVSSVGKNIAPHLKALIGTWFVGQCDSYVPAATACESSLIVSFPDEKKLKAFVVYRNEILTFIKSGIDAKVPSTKAGTEKDQEDTNDLYRRLSESLSALALFLTTVVTHKFVEGEIEDIFSSSRFWKFPKHVSSNVRRSFYDVIAALCSTSKSLALTHIDQICKSVMYKLNEENIMVCKSLYGAAESIVMHCDVWSDHVDMNKGLLPQICTSLKNGCYGCVNIVCPVLVKILSSYPKNEITISIYTKVFENLKLCLNFKRVQQSKSDLKVVYNVYFALIKLAVKDVLTGVFQDDEMVSYLKEDEILPSLKSVFSTDSSKFISNVISSNLCSCLMEWSSDDDNQRSKSFCDDIWKLVGKITNENLLLWQSAVMETPGTNVSVEPLLYFIDLLFDRQKITKYQDQKHASFDVKVKKSSTVEITSGTQSENFISKRNMIACSLLQVIPFKQHPKLLNVYAKLFVISISPEILNLLAKETDDGKNYFVSEVVPNIQTYCNNRSELTEGEIVNLAKYGSSVLKFSDNIHHGLELLLHDEETRNDGLFDITLRMFIYLVEMKPNDDFLRDVAITDANSESILSKFIATLLPQTNQNHAKAVWKFMSLCAACVVSTAENEEPEYLLSKVFAEKLLEDLHTEISSENKNHFDVGLVKNFSDFLLNTSTRTDLNITDNIMETIFLITNALVVAKDNADDLLIDLQMLCDALFKDEFVKTHPTIFNELITNLQNHCGTSEKFTSSSLMELFNVVFEVCLLNLSHESGVFAFAELLNSFKSQKNITGNMKWENKLEIMKGLQIIDKTSPSQDSDYNWDCVKASHDLQCAFYQSLVSNIDDGMLQESVETIENLTNVFDNFMNTVALSDYFKELYDLSQILDHFDSTFANGLLNHIFKFSLEHGGIWCNGLDLYERPNLKEKFHSVVSLVTSGTFELPVVQVLLHLLHKDYAQENWQDLLSLRDFLFDKIVKMPDFVTNDSRKYLFQLYMIVLKKCYEFSQVLDTATMCQLFSAIMTLRTDMEEIFAFGLNICEIETDLLQINCDIADFIAFTISADPDVLSNEMWDFSQCSLVSWLESVFLSSKSINQWDGLTFRFIDSSFNLLRTFHSFMTSKHTIDDPSLPHNLVSEWNEFFFPNACSSLLPIFCNFYGVIDTEIWQVLYSLVSECFKLTSVTSLLSGTDNLKPQLSVGSELPDDVQTLLNHMCTLMCSKQDLESVSFSHTLCDLSMKVAHHVVTDVKNYSPLHAVLRMLNWQYDNLAVLPETKTVQKHVMKVDNEDQEESSDDEEEHIHFVDEHLTWLENNRYIVHNILLCWKILISTCKHLDGDERTKYIKSIEEDKHSISSFLLPFLFELMPEKKRLFREEVDLNEGFKDSCQHLACLLYKELLFVLPALCRKWYNELPKVKKTEVSNYTATFVTPYLCEDEIKKVLSTKTNASAADENSSSMKIMARIATKEVVAVYNFNEMDMEIVIKFPDNHPLTPVQITTEKRAGVVAGQWRYWILQITTFLQFQNGSVVEGLNLWKRRVDKQFDGLEECMICFSMVHGTNQSLPKLQCKTCKKKYHAECLYKWFDTSNQSTCPLCRTPMIFR